MQVSRNVVSSTGISEINVVSSSSDQLTQQSGFFSPSQALPS
jgi:hypothetical protein